jgi:hypothetical protein
MGIPRQRLSSAGRKPRSRPVGVLPLCSLNRSRDIPQLVELLLLRRWHDRAVLVESDARVADDGDGSRSVGSAASSVVVSAAAAEVPAEEDAQSWGGGADDACLQFELGPDHEVEGVARDVVVIARYCEGVLVGDGWMQECGCVSFTYRSTSKCVHHWRRR